MDIAIGVCAFVRGSHTGRSLRLLACSERGAQGHRPAMAVPDHIVRFPVVEAVAAALVLGSPSLFFWVIRGGDAPPLFRCFALDRG